MKRIFITSKIKKQRFIFSGFQIFTVFCQKFKNIWEYGFQLKRVKIDSKRGLIYARQTDD